MSPLAQRPGTLAPHAGWRAGAGPIYQTTSYRFELAGGREAGRCFIDALELFHQRSRTQLACWTAMFGIEHVDDVIADIERGLAEVGGLRRRHFANRCKPAEPTTQANPGLPGDVANRFRNPLQTPLQLRADTDMSKRPRPEPGERAGCRPRSDPHPSPFTGAFFLIKTSNKYGFSQDPCGSRLNYKLNKVA